MGKVVRTVGKIAGVVAAVAAIGTGIGAALGGTMMFTAFGGAVAASTIATVAGAVSLVAGTLAGTPKIPQSATQLGRLQATLDTQAPRTMAMGNPTALPVDIRYYEGSGEDEEYVDYIIALAAHKIGGVSQIWFEDELAWSSTGGVQGEYVGYLSNVNIRTEGTAANTIAINGGSRWGSDDRLTGCAYLRLRIKRTGNSDNEQSPLASGLPGRVTVIGTGMPMYDPRYDSTVGGSGSQRIDNQATWGPSSNNPIIQALNVLIGWRINGKLSVGAGLPAKYLDLDSAITAANMCDEPITLSTGGTQPRYRTAGAFSTDDAPMNIVTALLAGCAGDLLDSEGRLSFLIKANTLATPSVTFDDHDVVSGAQWDPMGGQTNLPNIISGSRVDADALYQMSPYPSVELDSEDGIDRTANVDFGVVENAPQAERLAKQTLQRMQYPGTFTAEYNMKGMAAKVGSIVWQSYSPRAWLNKPFRVVSQKPSRSGRIALVLREEHEDIYAWENEDSAAVQAAEAVGFDPRNSGPILLARKAAQTADWPKVTDSENTKPEDNATVGAPAGTPVGDRFAEDITAAIDEHAANWLAQVTLNAETAQELEDTQTSVAANAQAIVDEVTDRQAAVQASADTLNTRIDGIVVDFDATVTGEVERLDGLIEDADERIAAEIGRVDAMFDTFSLDFGEGAYEVEGETVNARSLVLQEQSVRATQNSIIARDISVLAVRMGSAEAGILTEQQARIDGDGALASDLTALTTRVGDNESAILTDRQARIDGDAAIATDLTALTTRVGNAEADILTEQTARVGADQAIASDVTALTTRVDDAEADIIAEQTARSSADEALATDITGLSAGLEIGADTFSLDFGDGAYEVEGETVSVRAAVLQEQSARASRDAVVARDFSLLTARVGTAESAIVSEQEARSDADGALATSVDALATRMDDAESAIVSEQEARSDADGALATSVDALVTRMDDAESAIVSEQEARTDADGALATDFSGLRASFDIAEDAFSLDFGEASYEAPGQTVGAEALVLSERAARVSGQEIIARDVTSLTTRVAGNEATITTQAASINGLKARYGVTLNVNGHVTGFAQNNDGTTGSFTVVADKFAIVKPGGGTPSTPFIVDGGVVYIAQSYIKNLAVDKITSGNLGAEINVGAGKIIYDNGTFMKVTGVGFGSSNQFLEWFGPKMAISSCTEANAITYLKTNGDAYFGGSLSAGVLKNAATSTSLASNASLAIGPFGTNGGPIVLVTSYFARSSFTNSYPASTAGKNDWESAVTSWGATATGGFDSRYVDATKSVSCNLVVRVDRNGVTNWATLNITSCSERLTGSGPSTGDGLPGQLQYTREVSGSITSTDNAGGTTDRTFTATITDRTGVVAGTINTQQLSLTATEE